MARQSEIVRAIINGSGSDHLEHHQGISSNITATITGLALAACIGWLLYTNPWLLEGETKVTAAQPDTSTSASLKIHPQALH